MYDQRLFNQSSGLSSGFQGSDSYDLYDKPLFESSNAKSIYRPTKSSSESIIGGIETEKITSLLKPSRGFKGTESTMDVRSGPVQFEKETDVFGVDAFMNAAKRGRDEDEGTRDAKKLK